MGMGKTISLVCFVAALMFALFAGVWAVVNGALSGTWASIAGLTLVISQIAAPVNISKIIETFRGNRPDGGLPA